MYDLIEIRWHGRGGQGVVTAGKLLAGLAQNNTKFLTAVSED